ncbi:hypothetical protein [Pantoea stewartii]|uniref:hypothetical protein n=1 Tax=Pantoea stewartii TaxID=66269 RepID=UPI00197CE40D|nr:hypothetical protein [Pantoea stewartii]
MTCYTVAKTLYINNGDDEFFRYEIIEDEHREIVFAMAYIDAQIQINGISAPVWTKLDNISVDHLMPPQGIGFQTEVRDAPYPGKSISTVIGVCKEHRKNYKN